MCLWARASDQYMCKTVQCVWYSIVCVSMRVDTYSTNLPVHVRSRGSNLVACVFGLSSEIHWPSS